MPAGVVVRAQGAQDRDAVHAVISEAFGDPEVAELDEALADRPDSQGFVAANEERVVGHVRLTWGWLDSPTRLVSVLVLGPLSVAPQWQRHGIGRALVSRAVSGADERGAPLLFLEGDPAFYVDSGFKPATEFGFLRPSLRIPEPAFQVYPLRGYEEWMSGTLVYPDTFWQFDAVGLRDHLDGRQPDA